MQNRKKPPTWLIVIGSLFAIGACNSLLGLTPKEQSVAQPSVRPDPPRAVQTANFDADFRTVAERYFSSAVTHSMNTEATLGKIVFKPNSEYFGTSDKINKIMAIESARMFNNLPAMTQLKISIPHGGKTYTLDIARNGIEKYYGYQFQNLDMNVWRGEFLQKFDTKEARAAFADKFVLATVE